MVYGRTWYRTGGQPRHGGIYGRVGYGLFEQRFCTISVSYIGLRMSTAVIIFHLALLSSLGICILSKLAPGIA